jgi:hypothetical protein
VTRTVHDRSAEEVVAAINLHAAAANRVDGAARERLRRLLQLSARLRDPARHCAPVGARTTS